MGQRKKQDRNNNTWEGKLFFLSDAGNNDKPDNVKINHDNTGGSSVVT